MIITLPFTFTYSWQDKKGIDHTTTKTVQLTYDEKVKDDVENSYSDDNSFGGRFWAFIEELEEEYGVHDVGYCPDEEFCGYNSYEIEEDKIDEHWQKILDFFKTVGVGYVVLGAETSVEESDED